jgi:hypothetical protein
VNVTDLTALTVQAGNSTLISLSTAGGNLFAVNTTFAALGCPVSGACTIRFIATDAVGNVNGSVSVSVETDGDAPSITLSAPINGFNTSNTSVTINYTVSDAGGITSAILFVDGQENQTETAVGTYAYPLVFNQGVHNWSVFAVDAFGGNATSATYTFTVDTTPAVISAIALVQPDVFVSNVTGNNQVTILVNASDALSGIRSLTADASMLNQPGTGLQNLTYNAASGLWNTTVNVTNVSAYDFTPLNITLSGLDYAGNGITGPYTVTIVLYNTTTPAVPDAACVAFGPLTTDLSTETDFNDVNFIVELQLNGSASCNGEALPWGDNIQTVLLLNFTSLNMTSPTIGTRLMALSQAIDVDIVLPDEFGDSRIYVNSTAFQELDADARITLYGLPFTTTPSIENDDAGNNVSDISWISAYDAQFGGVVGNLTFVVDGFSGYNITDAAAPTITVVSPPAQTPDATPLVNVTINGTGTPISRATFVLNGTTYVYNSSTNTAGCINTTDGGQVFSCAFTPATLSEGAYPLSIAAYDYGGQTPGNNATAMYNFSVNLSSIELTLSSPAADAQLTNTTVNFTWTAVSGIDANLTCVLSINGVANGTQYGNGTFSSTLVRSQGAGNWSVTCTDDGNNTQTLTRSFTVDSIAPTYTNATLTTGPQLSGNLVWVNFSASETLLADPHVTIGGANASKHASSSGTVYSYSRTLDGTEGQGSIVVLINATDLFGNRGTNNTMRITTDFIKPVPTILVPASLQEYNASNVTVNYTAADGAGISACWYSIDDGADTTLANCANTSLQLADGSHRITLYVNDTAGNENSTTTVFYVDATNATSDVAAVQNATVNGTQLILYADSPAAVINVPQNTTNVTLDLLGLLDEASGNATINNSINITVNTTAGIVVVSIPQNTTITSASGWLGDFDVGSVRGTASTAPTADSGYSLTSTDFVLEVGANVSLNLSRAVRILLPGQSAKSIGWSQGGVFTKITATCANDTQATGDALAAGADCKIVSGSDMVVWTRHLTQFIAYTQTVTSSSSGGGGGGGGAAGSLTLSQTVLTKTISRAGSFDFLLPSGRYTYTTKVLSIGAESVTLKIGTKNATLGSGESIALDLTGDGVDDMTLRLKSFTSSSVTMELSAAVTTPVAAAPSTNPAIEVTPVAEPQAQAVEAPVVKPAAPTPPAPTKTAEPEPEKKAGVWPAFVFVLVILAALAVIFTVMRRRR